MNKYGVKVYNAYLAQTKQPKEIILSVVDHVDEKTPHMHISFVLLTEDKRFGTKEILSGVTPFNSKSRVMEIGKLLDAYISEVEECTASLHSTMWHSHRLGIG